MPAFGGAFFPMISAPVTPGAFVAEKMVANIPLLRMEQLFTRGGMGGAAALRVIGLPKLIYNIRRMEYLLNDVMLDAVDKGLQIFGEEAQKQLASRLTGSHYSTGLMLRSIDWGIKKVRPYIYGEVFLQDLAYPAFKAEWKRTTRQVAELWYVPTDPQRRGEIAMRHAQKIFGKVVPIPKMAGWHSPTLEESGGPPGTQRFDAQGRSILLKKVTHAFGYKFGGFNFMQAAFKKRQRKVNNLIRRAFIGRVAGRKGPGYMTAAGTMFPGGIGKIPAEAELSALKGLGSYRIGRSQTPSFVSFGGR